MPDKTTEPAMQVIDLRPPDDGILAQMLRLGLRFDHSDDGSSQSWIDPERQLRADFAGVDAETVVFTDLQTRLCTEVPAAKLPRISDIITWQSAQGSED